MTDRGRPTVYKPEFCQLVMEMGRDGKSKAQMAAAMEVSRETMNVWTKEKPEFSDAVTRAEDLSLAWWDEQGQKGVWGGSDFNNQAFSLQVRNRFPSDYQDRKHVDATVTQETALDLLKDN